MDDARQSADMRRVRTESSVRQDLVRFYGLQGRLRCVVTQSVQDVQAHHIWDNPSSSLFEELIPVTGDINRKFAEYALRELGKIDWVAPDPLLRPVVLLATIMSGGTSSARCVPPCPDCHCWPLVPCPRPRPPPHPTPLPPSSHPQ